MNEISFSYESMDPTTHFEKKTSGNSEMAYLSGQNRKL